MKRRTVLIGWGLGVLGAGLLGLAGFTIFGFVRAVAHRAPIITWDEGGWIALPVALALLVLVRALYIGRNRGPDVDGPPGDAIKRSLMLAACLLPFAIVFPLGARWLAGQHLEARGYVACGNQFWIAADRMPDARAALARCEVWQRG